MVQPAVLLVAVIVADNSVDPVPAFVESALSVDKAGIDLARIGHSSDAAAISAGVKCLLPAAHVDRSCRGLLRGWTEVNLEILR